MATKKIINDPIYGFISIPDGVLFDIMEHRYFQRLRRISQLGLTSYVYPGATHNRMCHAYGAFRLMQKAVSNLKAKGVEITEEEEEAVLIGILLHDIGHGPFSHALEETILPMHHEDLSIAFMDTLNEEFDGKLTLAIKIFKGDYYKKFLHQLISSQLDVDRMDYLNRDSFFTGVHEGVIGYDRLLHMINVCDNQLVVEEKGIYSVEKFLVARNLMYRQAYLHKTAIAAEYMLICALKRIKELYIVGELSVTNKYLKFFLELDFEKNRKISKKELEYFSRLDDVDILAVFKDNIEHKDKTIRYLCESILARNIFEIHIDNEPISTKIIDHVKKNLDKKVSVYGTLREYSYICGEIKVNTYSSKEDEIKVLKKNGKVLPFSSFNQTITNATEIFIYYVASLR